MAGSVAEVRALTLGGVTQWVTLRGQDAGAPILIWLNGGPGLDETFLLRHFNGAIEDRYLVVYWTQRGAGRSYSPGIAAASMRLDQFVADLDELIVHLRGRFGARKVILVGHSWGTAIGVAYAHAHPERVAAYVGIGQIADMRENERLGYEFALAEARRRGLAKPLADLTKIGPPPYPVESMMIQRRWLSAFGGAFHQPMSITRLIRLSLRADEATVIDLLRYLPGQSFSLRTLWPEISRLDFIRDRTRIGVPVAIFAGRHDRQVSSELARRYFEALDAPVKLFRWFEQSAHSPPFEEPATFNQALMETLDTLCADR